MVKRKTKKTSFKQFLKFGCVFNALNICLVDITFELTILSSISKSEFVCLSLHLYCTMFMANLVLLLFGIVVLYVYHSRWIAGYASQ